jgi:putative ABC transport system permease protein
MSFWGLVMKNPFRSKTRTILAVIGIAIGIATIVALGIITDGLKSSTEETLKAGGSDFMILESNVSDMMFSSVEEKRLDDLKNISGIKDIIGVLIAIYPMENNPYFVVMGIPGDKLSLGGITIIEGRGFTENQDELILGRVASDKTGKKVGDDLEITGKKYKITGIFETGDLQQDNGVFMSLNELQELENKEDKITMLFVKIDKNTNMEQLTKKIDEKYKNELMTIKSLEDVEKVDSGLKTIDTASWAISLLAIVIGGIGVINTMVMAVFERTREIGVLKAIGWKNKRILGMILGESIVITLVAGMVGTIMGLLAIQILLYMGMDGFIIPVYTLNTFLKAMGIALIVGIIGGLYPAYRASRLPPTEALRYE